MRGTLHLYKTEEGYIGVRLQNADNYTFKVVIGKLRKFGAIWDGRYWLVPRSFENLWNLVEIANFFDLAIQASTSKLHFGPKNVRRVFSWIPAILSFVDTLFKFIDFLSRHSHPMSH